MTTKIALVLFVLIVAVFVADAYWLHLDMGLVIGQQLFRLIDWVALWR